MTEIKKPEELAFAATELIADTAAKVAKENVIMLLASGAIGLGMIAVTSTAIPVSVFIGGSSLWSMHLLRKANLRLRDAFNQVSESLGEHDSVHQMDPLKNAFDKVSSYNKNDLNVVAYYKRNKGHMVFIGVCTLINPLLLPLVISTMISYQDLNKLKAVKDSTVEAQKNLRKKYPLTFDQS